MVTYIRKHNEPVVIQGVSLLNYKNNVNYFYN